MVISLSSKPKSGGWLMADLALGMALLVIALLPLAYSFSQEQKLCRAYYFQAVAMEIVDGELEVLRAGAWKSFQPGRQDYLVKANAAKNLPPGRFVLTVEQAKLLLEWIPQNQQKGGRVFREAALP